MASSKVVLLGVFSFLLSFNGGSFASQAQAPESHRGEDPICGRLDSFAGDVQVLDRSREIFLEVKQKASLPCGAWLTVKTGWARVLRENGGRVHLTEGTFIQVPEGEDHFVLYRGEFIGLPEKHPLRVVTANARVSLVTGSALVIFQDRTVETQVVPLEGSAQLENRFLKGVAISVRAGESSVLSLTQMRVVPGTPKAILTEALKQRLAELKVDMGLVHQALAKASDRAQRTFATDLVEADGRAPASPNLPPADAYERYPGHVSKLQKAIRAEEELMRPKLPSDYERVLPTEGPLKRNVAARAVKSSASRKPARMESEKERVLRMLAERVQEDFE